VPEGLAVVTPQGAAIVDLFWLTMVLSALVFLLVVGVLAIVLVRDRARPGDPDPEPVHGHRLLEITWTAIPLLLVAILFTLTVRTMLTVEAEAASQMRVEVVGHQWWWEYRYPDLGIVTANELYLPVNTPVRLELTSADVIHDFWVPRFGRKLDVNTGQVNVMPVQIDQEGVYDGFCAEYCGSQHAWMRPRVVVQSASDFTTWVQAQRTPPPAPSDPSAVRGEQLFASSNCVNCHTVAGTPAAARVGPDLTHIGSRSVLGAGVQENSPTELARWIRDPQSVKPGVLMPSYANLTEDDLTVLAAYVWSLK
jgi:cytochrome c oxidase subunit 2